MNDKIKELAEQAASAVREQHNNAYWRIQDETAEDSAWREKFAELIVYECCEEITKEPFNAGAASDWLKQQFGVKYEQ